MHKLYERASVTLGRVLTVSWDDLKREGGQGATEYGLVIAFVVLTIAVTVGALGTSITNFLGRVGKGLDKIMP
jgi:Flp pilus assembly pilin Flp